VPYRYRLIDTEGVDLGPFVSTGPECRPGDRIARGAGEELVVKAVVEPEEGAPFRAYLVVEAVAAA
jgi:hypothetical protein